MSRRSTPSVAAAPIAPIAPTSNRLNLVLQSGLATAGLRQLHERVSKIVPVAIHNPWLVSYRNEMEKERELVLAKIARADEILKGGENLEEEELQRQLDIIDKQEAELDMARSKLKQLGKFEELEKEPDFIIGNLQDELQRQLDIITNQTAELNMADGKLVKQERIEERRLNMIADQAAELNMARIKLEQLGKLKEFEEDRDFITMQTIVLEVARSKLQKLGKLKELEKEVEEELETRLQKQVEKKREEEQEKTIRRGMLTRKKLLEKKPLTTTTLLSLGQQPLRRS